MSGRLPMLVAALACLPLLASLGGCGNPEDPPYQPSSDDVPITLFRCVAFDESWRAWADWDGLDRLSGTAGGFQCTVLPWFDEGSSLPVREVTRL